MSNSCRPIFPATAYTGEDEIATALARHYRPHSTDHEPGMKATDLILLTRTPNYKGPVPVEDFLENRPINRPNDWGPGDEHIAEALAIASNMVPETLHDDEYNLEWEGHLRKLHHRFHFPSEQEIEECMGITDEDIRRGDWVSGLCRWFGSRANLEWEECLELSYFAEYDQSTDQEFFIVDNKGVPALHNAERHEQRCALNALWNHPEMDSKVESTIRYHDGGGFTIAPEVVEKTNVLDECGIHGVECQLIATGPDFAAGICRYGGIFVPRKFQGLIGDGGDFTARLTISTEGAKYPLRVVELNRC
tara:strand:- start:183 stop:1100 length:918 start_codon:yes stop_codon:yes gene_type:complete